ncbi:unnamed protein product, partial [Prorocentrum cordatum]
MTNDIRFTRVPRKRWPEGSMRPLYHFALGYPRVVAAERSPEYAPVAGQLPSRVLGYIPQVPQTYGYWDTTYGVQNEVGLSIGESTCTANTVGWASDVPHGYNKAGIEELSKIAMERCETARSARCAVEIMGKIAVEEGFYSADSGDPNAPAYGASSECLAVGDASGGLWLFNVLTGANNASAIWAAQRMPSNAVVAIGNSFTIRKMNLSDPENFLYSPGITKLAEEKGWWSPRDETSSDVFDFFGAYGYTPGSLGENITADAAERLASLLAFYSGRRMWRVFSLLSPEEGAKLDPDRGNLPHTRDPYPAWVPAPAGSVTLPTTRRRIWMHPRLAPMVLHAYRDHMEGTPYDLTKGMAAGPHGNPNRAPSAPGAPGGQWERAISMFRTTWSFVNVARPGGRSVVWFGYDAAHGTAYIPFYGAATRGGPECYHSHDGTMAKFSFNVAWTPFGMLNSFSEVNFGLINGHVRAQAARLEAEAMRQVEDWEKEADWIPSPEASLDLLTARSNAFAEEAVKGWWKFMFDTFLRFGHDMVTFNDSATGVDYYGQRYPDWWLESRDVGYTTWSRHGDSATPDLGPPSLSAAAAGGGLGLPSQRSAASPPAILLAVAGACASLAAVAHAAYSAGLREGRKGGAADVRVARTRR